MPQDLPGFYFDAEKNRYFPTKGPIPGSSRNSSPASTSTTTQKSISKPNLVDKSCRRIRKKTFKLLQLRELCGDLIPCNRGNISFQEEYQRIQASHPIVWKFQGTERIGVSAMELINVNIDRPNGLTGTDILFAATANGSLSFYVVGKVRQQFDNGIRCMPDRVWPHSTEEQERFVEVPGHIWRPSRASANLSSNISSLKMYGKDSEGLSRQHLMITSLGSEASGGSVYTLNLSEPLDCDLSSLLLRRRIHKAASFNCTVWTADCNSDGSQAVVGTNLGAALVNLETGVPSWVFRCKSDVLSLQLDHPGKIVLCGLRNGAIVTVDTREKSESSSARLARHRIPYPARGTCKPSSRTPQNLSKPWFELQGNIFQSRITSMPSSISCLASLKLDDQCFLSSSMDGSDLAVSHGFENGFSDGSMPTAFSLRSIDWESRSLKNEVAPFHTVNRFDGNDFKGYTTHLQITIRLYDHRLMQRGPVQFYEGNVNSHTRIQLGVDPYERCFMSGGEDCKLRIWCIKSGELLFEDKFMSSVPSVVCWPGELPRMRDQSENDKDCAYGQEHSLGAWLGSEEGLFHVRWS